MEKFIKNYRWHLVFWICFIVYEVSSVKVITGVFGSAKNYFLHYPINIAVVYLISGLILPRTISAKEKKYALLILFLALSMVLFLMASNIVDRILGRISKEIFFGSSGIDKIFIGGTIYRFIYFMGFGVTLFLYNNRISILRRGNELEKQAMEKEQKEQQLALELAEAKNAYLRAQINPHFMLSTLSYIHDSTRISEPETAKAVLYLSKILRYALSTERGPEKILLEEEIEQVENLLSLTRIRKSSTYVNFVWEEESSRVEAIPFILLSLAENMLKHGNLSQAQDPGEITVSLSAGSLQIETRNLCSSGINDTGFHTGLSSIEQRLFHSYGSLAQLSYRRDTDNHFTTLVTLPVK